MELMQAVEHYVTAMKLAERYGNDHGDMDAARNAWYECKNYADRIAELEREVTHWKANHANMVARSRLLIDRCDLPLERTEAFKLMGAVQEELRDALKTLAAKDARIAELRDALRSMIVNGIDYTTSRDNARAALSHTDDLSVLKEFREKVIDECANAVSNNDMFYARDTVLKLKLNEI